MMNHVIEKTITHNGKDYDIYFDVYIDYVEYKVFRDKQDNYILIGRADTIWEAINKIEEIINNMEEVEGLDTLALKKLRKRVEDRIITEKNTLDTAKKIGSNCSEYYASIYAFNDVLAMIDEMINK